MTRKRQAGQAFILVLILLAIGALLIVPALKLTGTSLKSSQILSRHVRSLYAADGAQEYVLWKLAYDPDYAASFTVDGQSDNFSVDICGEPVDVMVVMRAVPGQGGMTLATEHVIRPTKTVTPDTVTRGDNYEFTYIIKLEQLSDNNTQGLDAIYDILPADLKTATADYVADSSFWRVDGGEWQQIDDPDVDDVGGQYLLRWPNPDTYGSENFTSPMRDFAVRQVKELKFKMYGSFLAGDTVQCNWVVLKMGDIITLSGPQAPITVGNVPPEEAGVCDTGGLLDVSKVSDPLVIQPGVETDIEYTVSITNQAGDTNHISEITDYLPPGFTYSDNSTGGITIADPDVSLQTINGVERYVLEWEFSPAVSVASGETELLTFWAYATKDVSGSYYNEVIVIPNVSAPAIFSGIGVSDEEYYTTYSWNTGMVIVPAYDSRTDADGVLIDANMALTLDSISITSWQIY